MSVTIIFLFILGLIVGSFLNVVIYRLHTNKSLSGRSHCLSCGAPLLWYELVPVISYLLLRGRCRTCNAHISSRYATVELLTAVLFLSVGIYVTDTVHIILGLVLMSLLVVVVVYDVRHTIIPDELVLYITGIAVLYTMWSPTTAVISFPSMSTIVGGILAASVFGVLVLVSHGRWMGLGDVKLAFPLGFILGTSLAWSMVVLSFWIGAIISVLLLLIGRYSALSIRIHRRGKTPLRFYTPRLTMKSEVPFAPFLVTAFIFVYLSNIDVFDITEYVLQFAGV